MKKRTITPRTARGPGAETPSTSDLLRTARSKSGLTQKDLAKRLHCTQQAVAQAERPDGNPTLDFLERWGRACGKRLQVRFR